MQQCAKTCVKKCKRAKNGKSILQMFAFSFFDGSHICRCLPILCPPTVPRDSQKKTRAKRNQQSKDLQNLS